MSVNNTGRELTVGRDVDLGFGEESLDLGEHRSGVAEEEVVLGPGEFDEPGARDHRSRGSAGLDVPDAVVATMEHEHRLLYAGEERLVVELGCIFEVSGQRFGTVEEAARSLPPSTQHRVVRHTRVLDTQEVGALELDRQSLALCERHVFELRM